MRVAVPALFVLNLGWFVGIFSETTQFSVKFGMRRNVVFFTLQYMVFFLVKGIGNMTFKAIK